jgi:hypothetical protein
MSNRRQQLATRTGNRQSHLFVTDLWRSASSLSPSAPALNPSSICHFLEYQPFEQEDKDGKTGSSIVLVSASLARRLCPRPPLTLVAEPSLLLHEQETLGHTIALSSSW